MAVTSTMMALGTQAPPFDLPDVTTGSQVTLTTFDGERALLVLFLCRHCPYVKHVSGELARLGADYLTRGVGIVGISSNDAAAYPDDAPDSLREMVAEWKLEFPVCYDETQDGARAYGAACTPDFFLFNGDRKLVYRGQLDNSRPGNDRPVDGSDLRAALEAVLSGEPVSVAQRPSVGCGIKWKLGAGYSQMVRSPE